MKPFKWIMKRLLLPVVLLAAGHFESSAQAQVYVGVRPTYMAPAVRPGPPSRRHIWIGEDWVWRGGRYVPVGGHWALPPRPGYIWIPGRWVQSRRGWHWMPGRWRRHY